MQQLAADVAAKRRQFATTLQAEAWLGMQSLDQGRAPTDELVAIAGQDRPIVGALLKGCRALGSVTRPVLRLYGRSMLTAACSKAWIADADAVEISKRQATLASADLGEVEMNIDADRNASVVTQNFSRAWMRLNLDLLFREQAEMIRTARAEVQSGKSGNLGDFSSVTIPGSKWMLSEDAATKVVTAKLTPLPHWATETDFTGPNFWLTPLDGSKGWKL
jgi:hypothetical protein